MSQSNSQLTHPDVDLIALGVRQPWIELILRGEKTIEVRSQPTNLRGTIYLYASKKIADIPAAVMAISEYELDVDTLPTGRLLGTVDIVDCRPCRMADMPEACVPAYLLKDKFAWTLANPQRLAEPLKVRFLPYGVWFYPFKRRQQRVRK